MYRVAGEPAGPEAPSAVALQVVERGRVRLTWDARAHPMVMVRDARTGELLSLARGGSATVVTEASELDLVLSDGVRSVALRMPVGRQ